MASWDKHLAVILPTYNESKNLSQLLHKIALTVPRASIIIVDDSNRNENEKIKKIARMYSNVEIIARQKKMGRGNAVLAGFTYALEKKYISYFVEMDTDLAHNPEELSRLHKVLIETNADVVIGSRYVRGSKIIRWPLRRLVMSKIINVFLRIWLWIPLRDFTNGYRMYTRKSIDCLKMKGLKESNFIVLSESVLLLHKNKFRIIETPTTFTDRKLGASTVGIKELIFCLISAVRIKFRYIK